MKNTVIKSAFKKVVAIFMLLNGLAIFSTVAQSANELSCKLTPSSTEKKAVLAIRNLEGKQATFHIKGKHGHTFLQGKTDATNDFVKLLNLENLPAATYYFSYTVEGVERSTRFEVKENKVVVNSPIKLNQFYTPLYCKVEGKAVNVFADNENQESLKIKIFNEKGSLVFSDRYSKEANYIKRLNLKNLDAGKYVLNVSQGKNDVTRNFVID